MIQHEKQAPTADASEQVGGQISILLVDDDVFVRDVMGDMLQSLGVSNLHIAANGSDAIHRLSNIKPEPDLIFCDLHMPGQDGFQLMEALANRQYKGGIVLISGQQNYVLHSGSIMARFHLLNFLGALEKPVSSAQLQEVLKKLMKT